MSEEKLPTKIYRYELEITDVQQIEMPRYSQILCVKTKNNTPCLWVEVYPNDPLVTNQFRIIGTGNPMVSSKDTSLKYLGTILTHNEGFVWHVYQEIIQEQER